MKLIVLRLSMMIIMKFWKFNMSKTKYRIMMHTGLFESWYYIQRKKLWWWETISTLDYRQEYEIPIKFRSRYDAEQYILTSKDIDIVVDTIEI